MHWQLNCRFATAIQNNMLTEELAVMGSPLRSLIASGTKLWLDSVDPDLVRKNRAFGATGATSNPIIVSDLVKTGRFDQDMTRFFKEGLDDTAVAWKLTDKLVQEAQDVFLPVWQQTK